MTVLSRIEQEGIPGRECIACVCHLIGIDMLDGKLGIVKIIAPVQDPNDIVFIQLYPVNPVSGEYTLSSPIFKEIEIELPDKKTFRISAPDASPENKYIKSVRLNGKELETPFISHEDIMNGGTLDFELTDKPCYYCFSGQVVEQQKQ